MTTTTRETIYRAIDAERTRQQSKFNKPHSWGVGDCSSYMVTDSTKLLVLAEECGEVSRAVLERDKDNLRAELVQVAAVAVAWLERLGVDLEECVEKNG
jgi:hypothetical protein